MATYGDLKATEDIHEYGFRTNGSVNAPVAEAGMNFCNNMTSFVWLCSNAI